MRIAENFGALPNINALYGTESDEDDSDTEEAARRAEADKYVRASRCSLSSVEVDLPRLYLRPRIL